MELASLHNMHLSQPAYFAFAAVAALLMLLAGAVLRRRHGGATVAAALGLRLLALVALAVLLSGVSRTETTEQRFEPAGVWRLALHDLEPAPPASDFSESPDAFNARVRNALADGTPPSRVEVHGPHADAVAARDAVLALGVPATAHWPLADVRHGPMLLGFTAPALIQPGEPVPFTLDTTGDARVRVLLNGEPVEIEATGNVVRGLPPGRHVLEAVLTDDAGTELQRMGHVVRVGEPPLLLTLGLDAPQRAHAEAITPDWRHEHHDVDDFAGARLSRAEDPVDVVLSGAHALYRLSAYPERAHELSIWVARGGGLFVTGDGARYVAPEFMSSSLRRILPVTLLAEAAPPEPEDPPVEEETGVAEVAKVSLIFVIDRSGSMDAPVAGHGTRWQMAVESVIESLKVLEGTSARESETLNTRVGVLAFTLSQNWVMRPQNILPFDRRRLHNDLRNLRQDREFDAMGSNTDIYAAMDEALRVMQDEPSAVKVIINLSDGADRPLNIREGRRLGQIRERAIASGINIVAVGIGDEFDGDGPEAIAARDAIRDMATKPQFAYIPGSSADASTVRVIFVDTVETAFRAYDDQKKEEEEDRRRREEEQEDDAATVDVLPGEFRLVAGPVAEALFGSQALPPDAPRAGWYAASRARPDAAVAVTLDADDDPPALVFRAYGMGRVGFWSVGADPESLGELAGWDNYAALVGASMRWLQPRETPDIRLVGDARRDGIRLLDPLPGAEYVLRHDGADLPLRFEQGILVADGPLPTGAAEVIERIDDEERVIGDVYVRASAESAGVIAPANDNPELPALSARAPIVTEHSRPWPVAALYLAALFLIVMPIERMVRTRT